MIIKCSKCGNAMPADAAFCDQCGASLAKDPLQVAPPTASQRCPRCGASTVDGQVYCEQCGTMLNAHPSSYEPLPTPSTELRCSHCHNPISKSDSFCIYCGQPQSTVTAKPVAQPHPSPPNGRLIMQGDSAVILLPAKNEIIIGREDPLVDYFPDIDLTPFGGGEQGVSRRHARILQTPDGYIIEDLGSKNHTFVNEERLNDGQRQPLKSGDKVRFGRVAGTFRNG